MNRSARRSPFARPAFWVALLVLSAAAVGMTVGIRAFKIVLQKGEIYPEDRRLVRSVPEETRSWRRSAPDAVESAETLKTLGTENYLTRQYAQKRPAAAAGDAPTDLQLHLAYYTGMVDTVPHVPERCFTGGGWQMVAGPTIVDVPMDTSTWLPDREADPEGRLYTVRLPEGSSSPGRRVHLPRELTPTSPLRLSVSEYRDPQGRSVFAGYVFIANGGWETRAEGVRLLAFKLNEKYAYYLKLQVNSRSATTPEELGRQAGELLDDLMGEILLCVPDWPKVQSGRWPPPEGAGPPPADGRPPER